MYPFFNPQPIDMSPSVFNYNKYSSDDVKTETKDAGEMSRAVSTILFKWYS